MSLSNQQQELQNTIKKSARTTGIVSGVIAGLISLWALSSQSMVIWLVGTAVIAGGVGFGIYKWRFSANSDSAKCTKCGATYSITQTDKTETPAGSSPKEEREEQEDGSTMVTTWTEERFNVTETYTCSKCADVTTKVYESSRRRDVKEDVIPKPSTSKAMDQKLERGARSGGMSRPEPEKPKSGQGRQSK